MTSLLPKIENTWIYNTTTLNHVETTTTTTTSTTITTTITTTTTTESLSNHYTRYARIVITTAAFVFHLLGLLAIHLHKRKTNQNIILCSLSLTELLLSLHSLLYNILAVQSQHYVDLLAVPSGRPFETLMYAVFYVGYFEMILSMFVLTLDLLLCALHPLKYRTRMTRARTSILVGVTWCVATILGVGVSFSWRNRAIVDTCSSALGVSYLVFLLIAYSFVIRRIRTSNRRFSETRTGGRISNAGSGQGAGLFRRQYLVPSVIILSFVLFYYVPYAVAVFVGYHQVLYLAGNCGLLVDALTYIFLSSHYRECLVTAWGDFRCCCCWGEKEDEDDGRSRSVTTIINEHAL